MVFSPLYAAVLSICHNRNSRAAPLQRTYYQDERVLSCYFYLWFLGSGCTLSISALILIIQQFREAFTWSSWLSNPNLPVSDTRSSPLNFLEPLFEVFVSTVVSFLVFTSSCHDSIVLISNVVIYSQKLSRWFLVSLDFYIVNTLASILCICASISIGQLFIRYRTALAWCLLLPILIQIVLGFYHLNLRIDFWLQLELSLKFSKDLILNVGFYLRTYYILKNKINLQ